MGKWKRFIKQFDFGLRRQNRLEAENYALNEENEKLREELRALKEYVKQLKEIIEKQKEQFEILLTKYHAVKGIHFIEKVRSKNQAKGAIMYEYCLVEYLNLRSKVLSEENELTAEDVTFMSMFSDILEGKTLSVFERNIRFSFIKEYIYNHKNYRGNIDSLQGCSSILNATFDRINKQQLHQVS